MKTYLIHVKTSTDRYEHMQRQFQQVSWNVELILEGDFNTLSDELVNQLFTGELNPKTFATSCAYKHLMAYQRLLNSKEPWALILEDDVFLAPHAEEILASIEVEIQQRQLRNWVISLEDTNNQFVPNAQLKKNQFLYAQKRGRLTTAYLIDRAAAQQILDAVQKHKCDYPIDWFQDRLAASGHFQIFWSSVALARQGSIDGHFNSLISCRKRSNWQQISFHLQRMYKKTRNYFR